MKVVAQIALGNALKVTSGRRDWSKKRRPLAVTFDDTVVVPTYGNDDLTQFPKKSSRNRTPTAPGLSRVSAGRKGEDCKVQKCDEGMARVHTCSRDAVDA
eukprot:CAMPEP_0185186382 /NCGR_PEP_ID=MMETSP1140-20130426/4006_1 /TAXON_ID=298111 /ORGANISM="Pavlova sp., Strain CCMP459" /LENGTH=99 /DNA_ID=CAMNT_0027752673 /DNA_START=34 /DNA_END=330 /DNA_ORIENTATION=-